MITRTEHIEYRHNGPIQAITLRKKPWTKLQRETPATGQTINDPRYGGVFGFGCIVADELNAADFWQHAWEITTRNATIQNNRAILRVNQYELFDVEWSYDFLDQEVLATVTITPYPNPTLLLKEPKLVFNGWRGYTDVVALDAKANRLGQWRLDDYPDPRKKTIQVGSTKRAAYVLLQPNQPGVRIYMSPGQWAPWYNAADLAPPPSDQAIAYDGTVVAAPDYCLLHNHLKQQTEITHWKQWNVAGIMNHGWEGGYGAPDCWNAFRSYPTRAITLRASLRIS